MATRSEIAQQILAHAEAHYEDGGWDVIVECHDEESLIEMVWGIAPETADTFEAALAEVGEVVSIWADRQADAINSAF